MQSTPGGPAPQSHSPPMQHTSQTQTPAQPIPARPPSRSEIERKLSYRSAAPPRSVSAGHGGAGAGGIADSPKKKRAQATAVPSSAYPLSSGNESDSSLSSSAHHFSLSGHSHPLASTSPLTYAHSLSHGGLAMNVGSPTSPLLTPSAGASTRQKSLSLGGMGGVAEDDFPELEGVEEGDEEAEGEGEGEGASGSDVDVEGEGELEKGMEGERTVRSGYLWKKQERRGAWKKKWFVLRTRKLYYYKDDKEYSLSRVIDLKSVHTVAPVSIKKHSFTFGIVTSKRTFLAKASSQDEMDAWVHAVNDVRRKLSEKEEEERTRREQKAAGGGSGGAQEAPLTMGMSMAAGPASPLNTQGSYFPLNTTQQQTPSPTLQSQLAGLSLSPTQTHSHTLPQYAGGVGSLPSAAGQAALPAITRQLSASQALGQHTQQQQRARQVSSASSTQPLRRDVSSSSRPGGVVPASPLYPQASQTVAGDYFGRSMSQQQQPGAPGTQGLQGVISSDEDEEYYLDPSGGFVPATPGAIRGINTQVPNQQQHMTLSPLPMSPTNTSALNQPFGGTAPSGAQQGQGHAPSGQTQGHMNQTVDPKKVILQSYLMKRSTRTGRKVWRKRWFWLTSQGLSYTKSHMDGRGLRYIPLTSILDALESSQMNHSGSSSDSSLSPSSPAATADGRMPGARRTRVPSIARKSDHGHASSLPRTGGSSSAGANHGGAGPGGFGGGPSSEHVFRLITAKRAFVLCAPSEEDEIKWLAAFKALLNREREKSARGQTTGGIAGAVGGGGGGPTSPMNEFAPPRLPPTGPTSNAWTGAESTTHNPALGMARRQPTGVPAIVQQPPTPSTVAGSLASPSGSMSAQSGTAPSVPLPPLAPSISAQSAMSGYSTSSAGTWATSTYGAGNGTANDAYAQGTPARSTSQGPPVGSFVAGASAGSAAGSNYIPQIGGNDAGAASASSAGDGRDARTTEGGGMQGARGRSATYTAKSAVAEVVRRFHPDQA